MSRAPADDQFASLLTAQGKEIQRLNGVYNNIMKSAGVDLLGADSPFSTAVAACPGLTAAAAAAAASVASVRPHVRACAEGRGTLVDANTVEVALTAGGTKRLRAKHILIATGGQPSKLDIPGAVRGSAAPLPP